MYFFTLAELGWQCLKLFFFKNRGDSLYGSSLQETKTNEVQCSTVFWSLSWTNAGLVTEIPWMTSLLEVPKLLPSVTSISGFPKFTGKSHHPHGLLSEFPQRANCKLCCVQRQKSHQSKAHTLCRRYCLDSGSGIQVGIVVWQGPQIHDNFSAFSLLIIISCRHAVLFHWLAMAAWPAWVTWEQRHTNIAQTIDALPDFRAEVTARCTRAGATTLNWHIASGH